MQQSYTALAVQAVHRARERSHNTGIHRHSNANRYFIFCVGQTRNDVARFLQWALQHDLGFKLLKGSYKGHREISFIANLNDYDRILPFLKEQESILILDRYNSEDVPRAELRNIATGKTTSLGRFVPASRSYALSRDSWTYDPLDGQYYVSTRKR